jgi:PAS domain S-box-containing protein
MREQHQLPQREDRRDRAEAVSTTGGGLLDLLRVAAMVLDQEGRVVLWSPEAEDLFGYPADEVLGRYGAEALVAPENRPRVVELFKQVRAGTLWSGVFPVRHADGSTRDVQFRNMRMHDVEGRSYALGLGADVDTVRRVETALALSDSIVDQSPVGIAVFDGGLRFRRVNPALTRINGLTAEEMLGRTIPEVNPWVDARPVENAMRHVLRTGEAVLDQVVVGGTRAQPHEQFAWSVSYYRIDDPAGRVLGLAMAVVDVSERQRAVNEVAEARRRLAVVADAGARIGTTLDLRQTARELADVVVPRLADLAAVDILDPVLSGEDGAAGAVLPDGSVRFRAVAVAAGYPTDAIDAADPVGELASYDPSRLVNRCVREARPILVPRVGGETVRRVARDDRSATLLEKAGVHSYLAAPLIARGEVLGTLSLYRTLGGSPFDDQDRTLACELAARAAISIDNARLYGRERETALTLQRSLLPQQPPDVDGVEIAFRYLPAVSDVGGDWFDVLPLKDGRVGLVVGDVMGKGVRAAAVMGQLRTATRAFARLDLPPAELLRHLDDIASSIGDSIATCVYAVCDPRRCRCEIASAGHLPPALVLPDGTAEYVGLPVGVPLGVGGVPFSTWERELDEGTMLAMFTDGLVENRHESIDVGLHALLRTLEGDHRPLEEACDVVLGALHQAPDDDVALLLARTTAL